MTTLPLPEPDTHCWDEDTQKDCWSHSPEQLRTYGKACAAAEREAIAKLVQGEPIMLDGREAKRGPGGVGTWYKTGAMNITMHSLSNAIRARKDTHEII